MTTRWTDADVPDQHGRVALVTGANTGIGYEAATVLAERGATVVLACRDHVKVVQAVRRIRQRTPQATVETLSLDLASMASIRHAALELHRRHPRLDLLINNAGLMMPPYGLTKDGFELQIGVNHLGHFALTGLLLDRLLTTSGSRVVTVGSITHKRGVIDFDDLHFHKRRYGRMTAYSQSKLANLLFSHELHRRLEATGADTIAVAAHPGTARTELARTSNAVVRAAMSPRTKAFLSWLVQDGSMGALPTLRAAVDPAVRGGEYYGPAGWAEFTGHPVRVDAVPRSHDRAAQTQLWEQSERLTGVTYQFVGAHH